MKAWSRLTVILLTVAMLLAMVSPLSLAATEPKGTLVVTYNDETTTTTVNRDHPSKALHFDVTRTGARAETAVLTLAGGKVVYWKFESDIRPGDGTETSPWWQGSEKADLHSYAEGYWHWIYTPSGILTISNSSGSGQPQYGKIDVIKFYDANANGVFDSDEVTIEDWKVHVWNITDDYFYGCMETPFTIENIPYGTTYRLEEQMPSSGNWRATTPQTLTVTIGPEEEGKDGIEVTVEFGNLCLGEGGGFTIGFWTNRNGEREFNRIEPLLELRELNLKNNNGDDFDPGNYTQFRTWLRGANAENMQYMLSAQLAAMKLNVLSGSVDSDSLVYAPRVCDHDEYFSVYDLMEKANEALNNSDATREYLEALKDAMDNANNNINFVQTVPCDFTFNCCD